MSDTIFVPVFCTACGRTSASEFEAKGLRQKLDADTAIELRCSYDDATRPATSRERKRIMELLQEGARVSQCSWLRLRDGAIGRLQVS
jgi:hypothetical protein